MVSQQPSHPVLDLVGELRLAQRHTRLRQRLVAAFGIVLVVLLGGAIKLLWDERALAEGLRRAQDDLAADDAASMASAVARLEANLERETSDPGSRAGLALTRAQLAFARGQELELARAAVQDAPHSEARRVAEGLLALSEDDLATARSIAEAGPVNDGDAASFAPSHGAWLAALVRLTTGDPDAMGTALDELVAEIGAHRTDPSPRDFAAYERTLFDLRVATGRLAEADEGLATARQRHEAHVGLWLDEALFRAWRGQQPQTVRDTLAALAPQELPLGRAGEARRRLALGLARARLGEIEASEQDLAAASREAPAWDRVTRALALEHLCASASAATVASTLKAIPAGHLADPERQAYEAWLSLADGRPNEALVQTTNLPQADPLVARVTALALTEAGRREEAAAWIERARVLFPERPDLEVAHVRAGVPTSDLYATEARGRPAGSLPDLGSLTTQIDALAALANRDPRTPRVHTALGEAHEARGQADSSAAGAARASAAEAYARAIEIERLPAHAAFRFAILTRERSREGGESYTSALALLERATRAYPELGTYAEGLGQHLYDMGLVDRAMTQLRESTALRAFPAEGFLLLVRIEAESQIFDRKPATAVAKASIDTWIETARKGGASAPALALAEAWKTVALGEGDFSQAVRQTVAVALAEPTTRGEAVLLIAHALLRSGHAEDAIDWIQSELRNVPRRERAPLHFVTASAQLQRGKGRVAAASAWRAFKASVQDGRPPREILRTGILAVELWEKVRQAHGAKTVARELSTLMPYHPDVWVTLGRVQLAERAPAEACESAEKALAISPDFARAHALQGECLLQTSNDRERARAALRRAEELTSSRVEAERIHRILARL